MERLRECNRECFAILFRCYTQFKACYQSLENQLESEIRKWYIILKKFVKSSLFNYLTSTVKLKIRHFKFSFLKIGNKFKVPTELKQPLYEVEPHITSADFLTFFKGFVQIVMTADFSAEYVLCLRSTVVPNVKNPPKTKF